MTGPLVGVRELADNLDDPALRIVDTRWYLGEPKRGRAAYQRSHIPGAVYADLERDLSAPTGPGRHPLPDVETFAATMGRLGVSADSAVVVYDDRSGAVAARLWWMLRAIGHQTVAVLDGGLAGWEAMGHDVSNQGPAPRSVNYAAAARSYRGTIDRDGVRAAQGSTILLDARSGDRYRGESEPIDPVAGHIPTAINAPYEANLGADGRFLPAGTLADLYRDMGVSATSEVVAYCGSGVTACHDILALTIAGIADPILYPGSWGDWATAGYPVATGVERTGP